MERWVKLVWVKGSYLTREAQPGYAPDPDISRLPPFNALVARAVGAYGIIRAQEHPIYRQLFGEAKLTEDDSDGDL
jgi:hypothetical protein